MFYEETNLKVISLEELEGMTKGKRAFGLDLELQREGTPFIDCMVDLGKNPSYFPWIHNIFSQSKEHYAYNVKIVPGKNCAGRTPIFNLKQEKEYEFLAGDPQKFRGTIRGVFQSKENEPYLVIETTFHDFLLAQISYTGVVRFLEILESV